MHRVTAGGHLRGVVRDHDGSWQFLDGEAIMPEDITTAHLHHVLARWPRIREVADLRPGEQAWLDANDTGQRSRIEAD